jgi:hypothetical protein
MADDRGWITSGLFVSRHQTWRLTHSGLQLELALGAGF